MRGRGGLICLSAVLLSAGLVACGGSTTSSHPAVTSGRPSPSSTTSTSAPAYAWYLSLGDSLAFGYQEQTFQAEKATGKADASRFSSGYADLIAQRLRQLVPGLATANYGCAGEDTTTFLDGGCPAHQLLHDPYAGAQAAAATAFLQQHPGRGLITLSLGANDALEVLADCPGLDTSCILPKLLPALSTTQANLTKIVDAIHALAPQASVLLLELYNPYVNVDSRSTTAIDALDGAIAAAGRASGATLVDARPVFDPPGTASTTICALTGICGSYQDIHPTAAGYRDLAALFLQAAGVPYPS